MVNNQLCVLVVDDETRIVRALRDYLKMNKFFVMEAYDGEEALKVFFDNNSKIDLILMDVMMPKKDGFHVLQEIREESLVPIIMLTAKGEEYDQLNGFKNGADDYISKPFSPSLLLARVNAVLKRTGKFETSVLKEGEICLSIDQRTVRIGSVEPALTPKEFDLLYFFMLNSKITLSREQILNSVWGYNFEGDIRTVDTHVKQLRNKMASAGQSIKTIHKIGYKFEVD